MTTDITVRGEGVRFSVRVCGVTITADNVLLQRKQGDPFWALPGGKCQLGEQLQEALTREYQEEIGIRPLVGRLLWVVEALFGAAGAQQHEIGFYFVASGVEDYEVILDATLEYGWFPLEQLPPIRPTFLASTLQHPLPPSPEFRSLVD